MLLWHSLIGPIKGLLFIDNSKPFNPIKFAYLPYNTQNKSCFTIDNIYSSDSNNLGFQLVFTNINNVVAVLDDMYSTIEFVRMFFPINNIWPKFINYFKQYSSCFQIINQVIHINLFNSLRIYPVFEDSNLSRLISLSLRW